MRFRGWLGGSSDREVSVKHYEEGARLVRQGKLQEAVQRLSKAIDLNPSFVEARMVKADACLMLQEWDDAIAEYARLLSEDPRLVRALIGRACARIEKAGQIVERYQRAGGKQYQLSFEELDMPTDKLLRSVAPDKAMWIRTTHALMELESAARDDAEKALRIEPDNAMARELLQKLP